jgi:hypothetical protein
MALPPPTRKHQALAISAVNLFDSADWGDDEDDAWDSASDGEDSPRRSSFVVPINSNNNNGWTLVSKHEHKSPIDRQPSLVLEATTPEPVVRADAELIVKGEREV